MGTPFSSPSFDVVKEGALGLHSEGQQGDLEGRGDPVSGELVWAMLQLTRARHSASLPGGACGGQHFHQGPRGPLSTLPPPLRCGTGALHVPLRSEPPLCHSSLWCHSGLLLGPETPALSWENSFSLLGFFVCFVLFVLRSLS